MELENPNHFSMTYRDILADALMTRTDLYM